MLRRERELRTQIQKLLDGLLFGLALWLAHYVRANFLRIEIFVGTDEIESFQNTCWFWLSLILIPAAPFLLETQGFYTRPLVARRRLTYWQLTRAALLAVILLVSLLFFFFK